MSDDGPRNVAASVHARLLNVSRDTGEDFNLLLIRHALERFLYRLSRSKYRDQFVLKDYFDIWRICRAFTFQLPRVAAALNATFKHRNTEIPTGELEGLSQEFVERWAGQWARLSDRYALRGELPPLQEVIQEIRDFITPVLKEASSNKRSDKSWTATKGWHRSGPPELKPTL